MAEEYILILGAGIMQKSALEAAKELGYKTLVVDGSKNALCVPYADRFENIDLKNKEEIANLALSLGKDLKAVFTAGTDFSANVAFVAQKTNLPSHTYEACLNASDKVLMRECFKKNSIPSPDFKCIERSEIANYLSANLLDKIEFPKVIKPADNMGARGCRLIRNKSEFLLATEDAVRNSRSSRAILEDYMAGPEFSIDALVYNGTFTVTGFADRHIFFPPYFIELGHTMPSVCSENIKNELINTFANAVHSLGLTSGAAKADIKYTKKGPMVGEIAARLSGGYMSGWTFPYSSNLNLTKEALKIALGKNPDELEKNRLELNIQNDFYKIYEVKSSKTSAERALVSIPGTVYKIYGVEEARNVPLIKDIFMRVKKGDEVRFPRNNVEKCANAISLSTENSLAVQSAQNAISEIVIRLRANNPQTQNFLEAKSLSSEDGFPYSAFDFSEEEQALIMGMAVEIRKIKKDSSAAKTLLDYAEDWNVLNKNDLIFERKDFNHRSIFKTFELFDKISPDHPELDAVELCRAMFRGGIQGMLYFSDCISVGKKGFMRKQKK